MNRLEAINTPVFFVNFHNEVESDTLYNLVMRCAERINSPNGTTPRLFIEATESGFALNEWNHKGRYMQIDIFDTKETAEDELFRKTYTWDFLEDEASNYFLTREEAESEVAH